MSTNPNRRPIQTAYRPPTTDQSPIPEREPNTGADTPTAPSMFSPVDHSTIPDMFETEAEYEDR